MSSVVAVPVAAASRCPCAPKNKKSRQKLSRDGENLVRIM